MKKLIFTLFFILTSSMFLFADGYKIKVQIHGVSDTAIYLGNYYADKQYAIDTIVVDKHGVGTFQGDEKLKGGIYMVFFPSLDMKFFELLVDDKQEFSLEADTSDFTFVKFKGSKQNTAFYEFRKYMAEQEKIGTPLRKRLLANENNADSTEILRGKLLEKEKEVKAYWDNIIKEWDGKLFASIIKAMKEPEMPEIKVPEYIENKDSANQMMRYLWYKDHFFDNIDLTDDRLIRTPFLAPKVDRFIMKVVVQHPDSIIKEGTKLIEASRGSEDIFGYLIRYMFGYKEKSKLMGMDKVFIEISERYYLSGEATWADSTFLAKIRERVEKEKPNLIGNIAPDLQKLETYEKEFISLHEIPNKYTVVIFWEPNCGHCKKTVPKLYKYIQEMKADDIDIQVLAIYTQLERKVWEKFIEDKELYDWINAYDKYYFTDFRNKYDIYSTPTIYLLDKDKKIIGKRVTPEQVEKIAYGMEGRKAPERETKKDKKKDQKDKH